VRPADRIGRPGLGDRVLEAHLHPVLVQPLDDLPGAIDSLLLGPCAGGRDLLHVDPVAQHVQIVRVAVDARHLDRGHALDPCLGRRRPGLTDARDRIVVGQRHHGDPRCGRGARNLGGWELPVGDRGMGLEVDQGGGIVAAGARRRRLVAG
jgi:hypothetical protein